ncbi:hypothetical protein BDW71DRAFT_185712 [Aspergillus fruticulosus]
MDYMTKSPSRTLFSAARYARECWADRYTSEPPMAMSWICLSISESAFQFLKCGNLTPAILGLWPSGSASALNAIFVSERSLVGIGAFGCFVWANGE